jgi:predicted house-cleaning noncanonical NTP pyrophosphatase (MazG superfamily)
MNLVSGNTTEWRLIMLAHGIGIHAAKHMLHHLSNKYDLNHKEEAKLKEMIKEFLSDDGKIDHKERRLLNDYAKAMGQDDNRCEHKHRHADNHHMMKHFFQMFQMFKMFMRFFGMGRA